MSTPSTREWTRAHKKGNEIYSFLRQLNRRCRHTWSERWDYTIIKKSETKLFAHWNSHRSLEQNKIFPPLSRSTWMILRYIALSSILFFLQTHSNNAASIRWENCFSVKTTGCCWFRWITWGEFEARVREKEEMEKLLVIWRRKNFFSLY